MTLANTQSGNAERRSVSPAMRRKLQHAKSIKQQGEEHL